MCGCVGVGVGGMHVCVGGWVVMCVFVCVVCVCVSVCVCVCACRAVCV